MPWIRYFAAYSEDGKTWSRMRCICNEWEFMKLKDEIILGGMDLRDFQQYDKFWQKEGSFTTDYLERLNNHTRFSRQRIVNPVRILPERWWED